MASIYDLPTEILQIIYSYATLHAALALSQTSKENYLTFQAHRFPILDRATRNTYSPIPEVFQLAFCDLHAGLDDDPNTYGRQRAIISCNPLKYYMNNLLGHLLELNLIKIIAGYGNVANRWVELYPQMRWRFQPDKRRKLCVHEAERLRRAIYISWTYQTIFHKSPREESTYGNNVPRAFVAGDLRTDFLRQWGDSELSQISDWLFHLRDFVKTEIFPYNEVAAPVGYIEYYDDGDIWDGFLRVGNGFQYGLLLDRVMKLDPREILLGFWEDKSFVVRQQLEGFEERGREFGWVGESLDKTLLAVATERMGSRGEESFYPSLLKWKGMLSGDMEKWCDGNQCPIVGGRGNGPDLRCRCTKNVRCSYLR